MFFFAILGGCLVPRAWSMRSGITFFAVCFCLRLSVDFVPTQNDLKKYKRWLCVLIHLNNIIAIMYFMHTVVVEHKTEHVQGQVPSNVNLSGSFSSLMFTALHNHFLLSIALDIFQQES